MVTKMAVAQKMENKLCASGVRKKEKIEKRKKRKYKEHGTCEV